MDEIEVVLGVSAAAFGVVGGGAVFGWLALSMSQDLSSLIMNTQSMFAHTY